MNPIEIAKNILSKINYMTIATVTPDGKPWNSPVQHVVDDELNLYWFSDINSQHSINISDNDKVFIVIFDSTAPIGAGKGLYLEAIASIVDLAQEIDKVIALKYSSPFKYDHEDFVGNSPRRVYKAVPTKAWLNDAEFSGDKFLRDVRTEININDLRSK